MKEWQFNVLFFVGVGGALFLLIGPEVGLDISQNPTAVTGIGAILTYILTQKKTITSKKKSSENDGSDEKRRRSRDIDENHEDDIEEKESQERNRRENKPDG